MKVRLLADDSKYPNIAIMKISTYHKQLGDDVEWYNPVFDFADTDILYHSRIFNFTPPYNFYPARAKIIKGGTGFDIQSKLLDEIENIKDLDYSLYPNCDYSIMFGSRGCIRQCPFCVVSKKEGMIHNIDLCNPNPKQKYIVVFDNNFFANPNWRKQLEILKSYNKPIEFNTGIDLRILTEEMCEELSKCKIKNIKCAWDNYKDKDVILPKLKLLSSYVKPYKITCYVLVGFENKDIVETDIERVETIWSLGIYPFAMGYIDFNNSKYEKSRSVKDFVRWCDNRFIFKKCKWEDYKNEKNIRNSMV